MNVPSQMQLQQYNMLRVEAVHVKMTALTKRTSHQNAILHTVEHLPNSYLIYLIKWSEEYLAEMHTFVLILWQRLAVSSYFKCSRKALLKTE